MLTPADADFIGHTLLLAAVQQEIFCPYTGVILDIRTAVLIDGTDHGHGMHVLDGKAYDLIEEGFFSQYDRADFDIYDGRKIRHS